MTSRPIGHGYLPLFGVLALALLALWSCGSPEDRYNTLSIFFDGVPLPESMRPIVEGEGDTRVTIISFHPPFQAERCEDCHGQPREISSMSLAGFAGLNSTICLRCHNGRQREYQAMHGPVAAVECLACHNPHESRHAHLLKAPTPKLCLQCHVAEDLIASGAPEHNDLAADCLTCHHGHGGSDPYFLRVNLSPPSPEDGVPTQDAPEGGPAPTHSPSEGRPDQARSGAGP